MVTLSQNSDAIELFSRTDTRVFGNLYSKREESGLLGADSHVLAWVSQGTAKQMSGREAFSLLLAW